jgi:ABC-type transport system substrate-binding protein
MHATDRQEIVDSLAFGMAPVAHSYMNQANPAYPEIEHLVMKYDYDPARAEQMIAALGYQRGSDRFFRDASGQPLQVEIRTSGGGASNRIIESLADYWRRAGVATDTLSIPTQRLRDLEWRATRPGFELTRRGTIMERVDAFHSREIQRPETRWVGSNIPRYANPEFDALIDRYFVTIPLRERTEIAGRIVQHISEQLPIMGLLYEGQPALISTRLANARGGSSEVISTRNVYQWELQ